MPAFSSITRPRRGKASWRRCEAAGRRGVMSQEATLALLLLCPLIADAQNTVRASRKVPGVDKPVCSPGAICFSGGVSEGQEFHKTLNTNLEFVLAGGWGISIVPKRPESDC